ncbi:MAG TPA: CHASE3 domain-containing protein [Terriglobales bacterium]|nr:CHASE3 domain-containing protein [Terriglobales bacterium]
MIRKLALQILAPVLLAFITVNAYLAVKHLRQVHTIAALTLQSSMFQADISHVLADLSDMETGQRGYLLTEDSSYLQPFTAAKDRIAADFATLRATLASRSENQRSLESQLESLANSKQAEMEHTIDLRQKGYRHRAFKLVASNEGEQYMDQARQLLASLSAAESNYFLKFYGERDAALKAALKQTLVVNLSLLAFTGLLLLLARYHGRILEKETARSREELAQRDSQLQKLTSALSNQDRFKASAIENNARLLLQNYGGFLPRQGHAYAEQIKEASLQMERLRQDLLSGSGNGDHTESEYQSVA